MQETIRSNPHRTERRRAFPVGKVSAQAGTAALCLALAVFPLPPTGAGTARADGSIGGLPAAVDGRPLPSLAPMLERVMPAVVNISTRRLARSGNPLLDDPFFRRFFAPETRGARPVPRSAGSGVIIDAGRGLVVTNEHVIAGADEVLVTLGDGRERSARIVGADPRADIALLAIEAEGLAELDWADSDALRVGDFCIAIGNPFGLGQTVTSGIVSALGRSGLGIEEFEDFVQTDAPINPGNSGGALVDLAGRLIGINTAIVGPAGGSVGIGFAIPANLVRDLVAELLEHGEVRRGSLGITAQPLTPELARALGADARAGVVVGRVRPGSSAEKAGLLAGDVIVAVDGRPVPDLRALRNRVGLVRIGQRLALDVLREGERLALEVTVETLALASPLLEGIDLLDGRTRDGRAYVEVGSVAADTPAARAGLAPGDIVLAVGDRRVRSVEELERLVGDRVANLVLLVQRGRERYYVRLG